MRFNRWQRATRDDRELRLWRVGRALSVTFVTPILTTGSVFYGLVYLLDFQEIDTTAKLDARTLVAHREATHLHTQCFSQAVDKLGSDPPAVRLGGIHALVGLSDDAPDQRLRQTYMDVLYACLQLPFTPDPGDDPAHDEEHHQA